MNISYTIIDGSEAELKMTRRRKRHNREMGASLTTKQYIETVWLPARLETEILQVKMEEEAVARLALDN